VCGVVGGRWGHGWGRGAVGAMSCAGRFSLVAISAIIRRLQVSFFLARQASAWRGFPHICRRHVPRAIALL
jgi:hypothetical protein